MAFIPNSFEQSKKQVEQSILIERKPIMIASSAFITKQIEEECLSIGFDFITEVPIKHDFLKTIFEEMDNKNMVYHQMKMSKINSICSSQDIINNGFLSPSKLLAKNVQVSKLGSLGPQINILLDDSDCVDENSYDDEDDDSNDLDL